MIEQKFSRTFRTEHRPVKTGVIIEDEGQALVFEREGDQSVVTVSTGADGEVFAGISLSRNAPPSFNAQVLQVKVPATKKIVLPRVPLTGRILVKVAGVKKTIAATAPGDATAVQLVGDTITLHASVAVDTVVDVTFQYELTVSEARTLKGDAPMGGLPSSAQGVIGMVIKGDISTSYFDASIDWAGALKVNLGVDGIFTVGGDGTEVPGAIIVSAPSVSNPQLVIALR